MKWARIHWLMKMFLHNGIFDSITVKSDFKRKGKAFFVVHHGCSAVHFPFVSFTSEIGHKHRRYHESMFIDSLGDITESYQVVQKGKLQFNEFEWLKCIPQSIPIVWGFTLSSNS